jgi:hypothetical protein
MADPAPRKPLRDLLLESSVIATCLAGLLTTVIGGYLLDRSKANALDLQREREKQQAIIVNQLEVLESLNSLLTDYKLAAEFVICDIVERDGATLEDQQAVRKSISAYDEAARAFLASAYREVFRTRIYFRDPTLCEQLDEHLTRLNQPGNMIAIDGRLSVQIAAYKQAAQIPEQARADTVFKTIALAPEPEPDHIEAIKSALTTTRAALRREFDTISAVLKQLADTTAAKQ